ncbi:MAG: hypothetical protein EOO45_03335 [Flavobacterium sp.]|nr:MAG: hypothetical protein EOO45_03335 [Flavobacterium sp.]
MDDLFSFAYSPYVKVEIHFQGRRINKTFFKKNPHLFETFPSRNDIAFTRAMILKKREQDVLYTIIVSEDGIYTVET